MLTYITSKTILWACKIIHILILNYVILVYAKVIVLINYHKSHSKLEFFVLTFYYNNFKCSDNKYVTF